MQKLLCTPRVAQIPVRTKVSDEIRAGYSPGGVTSDAMEQNDQILDRYADYLRENGSRPKSVFAFCKELQISEAEFFRSFGSFDAVEDGFWRRMIERVIASVKSGAEWESFGARERTLAFLFAFLEASLSVRSILLVQREMFRPMCRHVPLHGFARAHKAFMREVLAHGQSTNEIAARGALTAAYPEVFFIHLLAVIEFNLADTSAAFERTDAFVEKTVNFVFDLIRTQAIDSGFDLLRFLAPGR